MNEREKKVLEVITKTIPTLNEFSKGFVSGYLAAKEEEVKADKPEEEKKEDGKEES